MNEPPPYHERLADISRELSDRGSHGLVVIDASCIGLIEEEYGSAAYEEVRQRMFKVLREQQGKDFRTEDIVTLDRPRGLQIMLLLGRKRRRSMPTTPSDLKVVQSRVLSSLVPNLGRASFPYVKTTPRLDVGYAMAMFNPLVHPERVIGEAVRESGHSVRILTTTPDDAKAPPGENLNATIRRQLAEVWNVEAEVVSVMQLQQGASLGRKPTTMMTLLSAIFLR